jgi:hypothetical protein
MKINEAEQKITEQLERVRKVRERYPDAVVKQLPDGREDSGEVFMSEAARDDCNDLLVVVSHYKDDPYSVYIFPYVMIEDGLAVLANRYKPRHASSVFDKLKADNPEAFRALVNAAQ